MGFSMTRDEAVGMVQSFFRYYGLSSPGLNQNNLGGAAIGEYQVYFEYLEAEQGLKCSALVYRFHEKPKPGVLEALEEERDRTTNAGDGTLDYEPENKGIYLSRTYIETVSGDKFAQDLERLMKASEFYGEQVLDRVAAKVFG